jgi:hypothetical protein
MEINRCSGVQGLGNRMASAQVVMESWIAFIVWNRCSAGQGDTPPYRFLPAFWKRLVSQTTATFRDTDIRWTIIPFKQMTGQFPSATD